MIPIEDIQNFIQQYSFGILVSASLSASHLPFLLKPEQGKLGTLYGHFSRNNQQYKEIDKNNEELKNNHQVLTIFSGPHSYISPTWYARHPAVPTWNYVVAHAHGQLTLLGQQQTATLVNQLVDQHEPAINFNHQIMPHEYQEQLAKISLGSKLKLVT